jgi:iron-sulfur cluster assembly protein
MQSETQNPSEASADVVVPKGHDVNPNHRPASALSNSKAKIDVTAKAVEAIKKQIVKRGSSPSETALRLGIRGGGCSGFAYVIEFHDGAPHSRDREFEFDAQDGSKVRVIVDAKSLVYLNGAVLDWEQTLMSQGFKFLNPQEKTSCGCGHSFTV